MARNSIPKVALGWGIAALHRRMDDVQTEAAALHVIEKQEDLPEKVSEAYRRVVDEICTLASVLARFEEVARQGGIPLDETAL